MPKLSNPGGRQARVALNAAKAAGVSVKLNGGKLSLKASGPPPEAVVAALKNHKAEIVALLKAEQAAFDERAAIIEFDGGAPRAWAEALARLDPVCPPGDISPARWLQFIDDCGRFLDDGWAARAAALGWGRFNCSVVTATNFSSESPKPVCSGSSKAGSFLILLPTRRRLPRRTADT